MTKKTSWGEFPWKFVVGQGVLDKHGNCVFDMRSWGYLVGRLRIPVDEAAQIQDDLARKIVDTMNGANEDEQEEDGLGRIAMAIRRTRPLGGRQERQPAL